VYEQMAIKFFEHVIWIGSALGRMGDRQDDLWDEEDGFFYDVLRLPDGSARRLKVRSMVGLLPLCAATVFEPGELSRVPYAVDRGRSFLARFPHLVDHIQLPTRPGHGGRTLLAVLDETRLRRILTRMLDENEFLSPFGIRSLSRYHHDHPFIFDVGGREYQVAYSPAESHWRDLILFYEYFHGDNGAGIGASHQTGWTGDVALLSVLIGAVDPSAKVLDADRASFFAAFVTRDEGRRPPDPAAGHAGQKGRRP